MTPEEEGKPPILKTWSRMYWLVILNLAVTIFVFYLITIFFR